MILYLSFGVLKLAPTRSVVLRWGWVGVRGEAVTNYLTRRGIPQGA
jgi:hypothetical protein